MQRKQNGRRLLTISPYLTARPETGGTQRIHYLNRYIAEHGWDVTQFSIGPLWPGLSRGSHLFTHSAHYRELRHSNPAIPLANRMLRQFGGAQVAPSLLPRFVLRSPRLEQLIRERPIVMLEHPHAYGLVRDRLPPGVRLVLDSHNIESDIFAATKHPIARLANEALLAAERELMERADLVFFCSEEDRLRAIDKFGLSAERLCVAPNGTDVAGVDLPDEAERRLAKLSLGLGERPVGLFTGSHWKPNVEAAQKLVELARRIPDVTFLVVGRVGAALGRDLPANVKAPGFVPDLRCYAAAADFAVNPMFSGSGSNVKLFDYLAYGLPVVSTPFGARGLHASDGDALITSPIEGFPASIRTLFNDGNLARRRKAARSLGEGYDWRNIAAGMERELETL